MWPGDGGTSFANIEWTKFRIVIRTCAFITLTAYNSELCCNYRHIRASSDHWRKARLIMCN